MFYRYSKFTLPTIITHMYTHMYIHNYHYVCSQSGTVASMEVTNPAAVSGDTNQTYQVPNPIIHTPHPTTGVIYTNINPQKTKIGQKAFEEVD